MLPGPSWDPRNYTAEQASRARRKASLIAALKRAPADGGARVLDRPKRYPTPREIGERREWIEAELAKLEDVPILSAAELRRLPAVD
jgi:hypothetical protein